MTSPRGPTFTDSISTDCDELVDLVEERDEDTDDASEDGDSRRNKHQKINKDRDYFDKLNRLKTSLEELESGIHAEFNRLHESTLITYHQRREGNAIWLDYESSQIEQDYSHELLSIAREFEDKKTQLEESIIQPLEQKKKQIEQDISELMSMSISDPMDATKSAIPGPKPLNFRRKLRRRPHEPVPELPDKRRKTQISHLLNDEEIEEDLEAICSASKWNSKTYHAGHGQNATANLANASLPPPEDYVSHMLHTDSRIEDGKLFYEKRWFHRGQQVFVEGKHLPKNSGVISSISHDLVWIQKVNEQTKIPVSLQAFQKGKILITRRAD